LAKGRLLHKKICLSEQVNLLPNDTARLLYTWLIPHLDIEGRFYGDARRVKGTVFPLQGIRDDSIERYLQAMEDVGLIVRYEVHGQKFLWAPRFSLHQTLRKDRERKSYIPAPPDGVIREHQKSKYAKHMCLECGEVKEFCECPQEDVPSPMEGRE